MAKRKRLDPAVVTADTSRSSSPAGVHLSAPPIAHVAGASAAEAAARELADEIQAARADGRLVQDIPLEDIVEDYLSRDRLVTDLEDLEALETSIMSRGQQMPVDLIDLGPDAAPGPRYGLISGWRRLQAIKRLRDRTQDPRYDNIRAILRRSQGAAEAYLSMVEENELRVGLTYYERAQVAARASDLGVFDGSSTAIAALFPTASKAKRSKIGSFVRVFRVLDPVLTFPSDIPERLGLQIAKALDADQGSLLYTGLSQDPPPQDPAAEQARIRQLLADFVDLKVHQDPPHAQFANGVTMTRGRGSLKLSGPGVTDQLTRELEAWLAAKSV